MRGYIYKSHNTITLYYNKLKHRVQFLSLLLSQKKKKNDFVYGILRIETLFVVVSFHSIL